MQCTPYCSSAYLGHYFNIDPQPRTWKLSLLRHTKPPKQQHSKEPQHSCLSPTGEAHLVPTDSHIPMVNFVVFLAIQLEVASSKRLTARQGKIPKTQNGCTHQTSTAWVLTKYKDENNRIQIWFLKMRIPGLLRDQGKWVRVGDRRQACILEGNLVICIRSFENVLTLSISKSAKEIQAMEIEAAIKTCQAFILLATILFVTVIN